MLGVTAAGACNDNDFRAVAAGRPLDSQSAGSGRSPPCLPRHCFAPAACLVQQRPSKLAVALAPLRLRPVAPGHSALINSFYIYSWERKENMCHQKSFFSVFHYPGQVNLALLLDPLLC